jgi:sugar phosphate isomerase/epimerase
MIMKNNPTRRTFIKASALGMGAFSAGISSVAAKSMEPAKKKKFPPLKLGLMTWTLGKEWDLDAIINNCAEAKWVHAELRTSHKHGVELSLNKQQRDEVKKRIADSPLEAVSLASAYGYHYTDQEELKASIEGTKEYLQLAADVGAIGIRVFPNAFPEGVTKEKTMEQIGKSLAEVGEFGNNVGVDVRVCVHGKGTNYVPVIRQILDYSQSEHVYVNWNCDMNDAKGDGLEHNFNLVKDKIRGVHMHALHDEYPYREFFKLLRESGYQGYCNAEINESCEPITLMKYYRGLFLALQDEL